MRVSLILAGLNGAMAVGLGAFAAHGMAGVEMDYARGLVEKGAHYQLIHAVALTGVAALYSAMSGGHLLRWTAMAWVVGIVFFCGSLYAIAFSGIAAFGMVAPVGGTAFIIGWLLLALTGWRHARLT
ncbi:MAG: DUF423 domain-containing protein [Pseudomonadota bacterium]